MSALDDVDCTCAHDCASVRDCVHVQDETLTTTWLDRNPLLPYDFSRRLLNLLTSTLILFHSYYISLHDVTFSVSCCSMRYWVV